jgi:D-xylulose reductase
MGMTAVNITKQDLKTVVDKATEGWGADVVFEASGNENAVLHAFEPLCPGGCVVFIGMPVKPVPVDIVSAQAKEARIETIFRYAHVYPRAINLMESGKINVKPMITDTYKFADSIRAFEYAANPKPTSVKVAIEMQ